MNRWKFLATCYNQMQMYLGDVFIGTQVQAKTIARMRAEEFNHQRGGQVIQSVKLETAHG